MQIHTVPQEHHVCIAILQRRSRTETGQVSSEMKSAAALDARAEQRYVD
jgi:hypothetical protein